jgi:hypothetical protein
MLFFSSPKPEAKTVLTVIGCENLNCSGDGAGVYVALCLKEMPPETNKHQVQGF